MLEEWGCAVTFATMPLRESLAWLRPGDALVLGLGWGARYSLDEAEALVAFVEGG